MGSFSNFETQNASAAPIFSAKTLESTAFERNPQHEPLKDHLADLYSENVAAKVLRAAVDYLLENVNK